jgi:hypothetical protein
MSQAMTANLSAIARPALRLWREPKPEQSAIFWRVNGYLVSLHLWTLDEWETMDAHPNDAQFHERGFWCALRVE